MKSKIIPQRLVDIAKDNRLGSRDLLLKLNTELLSYEIDNILSFLPFLKKNLQQFETISKYLAEIEKQLKRDKDKSFLIKFSQDQVSVVENIYSKHKNLIDDLKYFITISNSRTVEELLKIISKHRKIEVVISEARPVCEGNLLAERLSNINEISVRLCTEAQLPNYIIKCDAIIIGADKIFPNGNIVNKTGSKLLGILSGFYQKPFYVIADNSKFSDYNNFIQTEEQPSEIYAAKNKLIKITNEYFEIVDSSFITSILTD